MPKKSKGEAHSAYKKAGYRVSMDHWYGHQQHIDAGASADPIHEAIPKGVLKSTQYIKGGQKRSK